jgi:hypothetical protein
VIVRERAYGRSDHQLENRHVGFVIKRLIRAKDDVIIPEKGHIEVAILVNKRPNVNILPAIDNRFR